MNAMRNPEARHLDFGDLVGAIPQNPKALPSNLDMIMERNGRFLVGEWKRAGEALPEGQRILLQALARHQAFKVFIVQGNTDAGMTVEKLWKVRAGGDCQPLTASVEDLRMVLRDWYAEADK